MKKPIVIGIDGIHRSGKGTQKKMLTDYLSKQGNKVYTLRGEYYRTGTGEDTSYFNPYSSWWLKNATNTSNFKIKSDRIERELYYWLNKYLPGELKNEGYEEDKDWYVVLDRTIFSRAVSNVIYKQHGNIDPSSYFSRVSPDIILILEVGEEEVSRRIDNSNLTIESLSLPDINYKRDFINSFFGQPLSIKDIIEKDFLKRNSIFVPINASNIPQKVSENIITTLRSKGLIL